MAKPKTPMQIRAARHLALLRKTTTNVTQSKLPPRTSKHLKLSHGVPGGRYITRLDKGEWEERVDQILRNLEENRYSRSNALYFALSNVKTLLNEMEKKKADLETYMEELQASNEEMRASNEEMRILQNEAERTHEDTESILAAAPVLFETPLKRIKGDASALAEACGDRLDPEELERLFAMAEEAALMEKRLGGLTDYWRMDVEGGAFETVDCEGIMGRVEEDLEELINTAGAEITHDPLPAVKGDGDQMTLLFTILLNRALSLPGGHPLRIHVAASPVEAEDTPEVEKGWAFRVEDNGADIPEEDRERMFKVNPTGTMDPAVAWRIVSRHGGGMTVAPKAGGGNVFEFSLPA